MPSRGNSRSDKIKPGECTECGGTTAGGAERCLYCGAELPTPSGGGWMASFNSPTALGVGMALLFAVAGAVAFSSRHATSVAGNLQPSIQPVKQPSHRLEATPIRIEPTPQTRDTNRNSITVSNREMLPAYAVRPTEIPPFLRPFKQQGPSLAEMRLRWNRQRLLSAQRSRQQSKQAYSGPSLADAIAAFDSMYRRIERTWDDKQLGEVEDQATWWSYTVSRSEIDSTGQLPLAFDHLHDAAVQKEGRRGDAWQPWIETLASARDYAESARRGGFSHSPVPSVKPYLKVYRGFD